LDRLMRVFLDCVWLHFPHNGTGGERVSKGALTTPSAA
jgi:hypothetical protein